MTSIDFEDDLRRRLSELAELAPAEPSPTRGSAGQLAPYVSPPRSGSRRPALTLAAAAAVAVLCALLAVAVWSAEQDPSPRVVTDTTVESTLPPTTTTPTSSTSTSPSLPAPTGAVVTVPAGPGYGRTFPVAVWTGTELVVWGGEVVSELQWSNAGGAYDPASGNWRPLSPSPLPPMSEHSAVWTGDEVIICCGRVPSGTGAVAAAYRPADDTWRTLAAPPFDGAPFAQAVWTGTEMIVTGGSDYRGAAAYDPATDRWRTLADPPGTIERAADSAWTGSRLIAWNRSDYSGTEGFSYDPASDTWERLPDMPPELSFQGGTAAVVGEQLVVWGARPGPGGLGYPTGAVLDLTTGRWRPLPDAPAEPTTTNVGSFTSPSSVSSGSEAIIFGGDLRRPDLEGGTASGLTSVFAFDPGTSTWRVLGSAPASYHPSMVWAGDRAFVLGDGLTVVTP